MIAPACHLPFSFSYVVVSRSASAPGAPRHQRDLPTTAVSRALKIEQVLCRAGGRQNSQKLKKR